MHLRRAGQAAVIAAGILAVAVGHAAALGGIRDAPVAASVPDAISTNFRGALAVPGREAIAVLRVTFVAKCVYADPRVVDIQVLAGTLDEKEREQLAGEALRVFNAVRKWCFPAASDTGLPAPGSALLVPVRFRTLEPAARD
jgi:hypothetical protein